jgi:hypothetical protein
LVLVLMVLVLVLVLVVLMTLAVLMIPKYLAQYMLLPQPFPSVRVLRAWTPGVLVCCAVATAVALHAVSVILARLWFPA